MRRTYPQIIMLNYAANRSYQNAKRRSEYKYGTGKSSPGNNPNDPFLPEYGMTLSELKENHPEQHRQYQTCWTF